MKRFAFIVAIVLLGSANLRAQETVQYFDRKAGVEKQFYGAIQQESPAGISMKQGTQTLTIAATDIRHVIYPLGEVKSFEYNVPFNYEKAGIDPKRSQTDRRTAL